MSNNNAADKENDPQRGIVNPYNRDNRRPNKARHPAVAAQPAQQQEAMGIQSQKRQKNTQQIRNKQPHQVKKKQKVLFQSGMVGKGFDSDRDCNVCVAIKIRNQLPEYKLPHRKHHVLCTRNIRTKGVAPKEIQARKDEEAALREFNRPPNQDAPNSQNEPSVLAYFGKNAQNKKAPPKPAPVTPTKSVDPVTVKSVDASSFLKSIQEDATSDWIRNLKRGSAPAGVVAAASWITTNVVPSKIMSKKTQQAKDSHRAQGLMDQLMLFFGSDMHITIPEQECEKSLMPIAHSVRGTKIYLVYWQLFYPTLTLRCPDCGGSLSHDRTNFSKNKGSLFPIYRIDGPPDWAIVMKYKCGKCPKQHNANDGAILHQLPEYIRANYPVYPRYAAGTYHLNRPASDLFEEMMITYGNGDFFSKLMYNSINKHYLTRLEEYLSYHQTKNLKCDRYPEKDGEFLSTAPPTGTSLRSLYETVAVSKLNYFGISDNDRHTREIQSVTCSVVFAQDHTMEVVNNYKKKVIGAHACWDAASETGEIATAVLVPSTRSSDYAHAAEQMIRRPGFTPKVMYADTWPSGEAFWNLLFGKDGIEGRLGLFHYSQRIVKTLRPNHIDYRQAVWELMACMYELESSDMQKLLKCLKDGSMSPSGYQYSDEEIEEMKLNRKFKQRYFKYLRKKILPAEVVRQNLHKWFVRYKVEASEGKAMGGGRVDPFHGKKLFTPDTKPAIDNQVLVADCIQDPLSVEEMYRELRPSPRSKHKLTEYQSLRVESRLEGFHDPLGHFGNTGMNASLCDALNLTGTARYNLAIRHRIYIGTLPPSERGNLTLEYERIPSFYNHTRLKFINEMAKKVGWDKEPFPFARPLPEDNGERFFSQYLAQHKQRVKTFPEHPDNSRCQCNNCAKNPRALHTQGPLENSIQTIRLAESPQEIIQAPQQQIQVPAQVPVQLPAPVRVPVTVARGPPQSVGMQQLYRGPMHYGIPNYTQTLVPIYNPYTHKKKRPKIQKEPCCPPFVWWSCNPCRDGRPPHAEWCHVRIEQQQSAKNNKKSRN